MSDLRNYIVNNLVRKYYDAEDAIKEPTREDLLVMQRYITLRLAELKKEMGI